MSTGVLDYITIKGFKSIKAIERLPLKSVNVVIGPNGAGKSNFIGVFAFLNAIREGRLQKYMVQSGGADKLLHFGSRVTQGIELHLSFFNETNQYALDLKPTDSDGLYVANERTLFWDKEKHPRPYEVDLSSYENEARISEPKYSQGVSGYVRDHLQKWRLYHFQDTGAQSPMKKTALVNDNCFLRPDGSNLAAFLYLLHERYPESYALIRRTIQRIAPFFDDFKLEPARLNTETILLEWKHRGTDAYFNAAMLSDGTLRFIALATLFLQPTQYRPSIIIIDEPELGLHPYAISMLATLIKQAALENQIIIGTQSALLLDHFEPEDVLVADRVDGGTQLTRLEAERLGVWLENYSLGQLWEKNQFGGRPVRE